MKTKTKRLFEIRRLISSTKISNQEELLSMLSERGYSYTQATLSRDLKFLKVGKMVDEEKGNIFVLPENNIPLNSRMSNENFSSNGFVSIAFANNLAIIKTLPGFANGIAYTIDKLETFDIMGTIAGDDTILIIAREGVKKNELIKTLALIIPEIEDKIKG